LWSLYFQSDQRKYYIVQHALDFHPLEFPIAITCAFVRPSWVICICIELANQYKGLLLKRVVIKKS
jgi:hypothetical protein